MARCLMTTTSHLVWRSEMLVLEDSQIAGQLRTDADCVDEHMRCVAAAAAENIETDIKVALVPQVREVRLSRFPDVGRGLQGRIWLDWRTVWTPERWTAFSAAADEATAPQWMKDAKTEIIALFGDEDPPLRITYSDCCDCDEITVLDPETYKLTLSGRGDYLCPIGSCRIWPCLSCRNDGCERVTIQYVAGFQSPTELKRNHPQLVQNMLATFGYLYEQPEVQSVSGRTNYQDVIAPLRRNMRWRPG